MNDFEKYEVGSVFSIDSYEQLYGDYLSDDIIDELFKLKAEMLPVYIYFSKVDNETIEGVYTKSKFKRIKDVFLNEDTCLYIEASDLRYTHQNDGGKQVKVDEGHYRRINGESEPNMHGFLDKTKTLFKKDNEFIADVTEMMLRMSRKLIK